MSDFKVCYLSGTRADFGLMRNALGLLRSSSEFELGLVVTGMHLDPRYGNTGREIAEEGFDIIGSIPTHSGAASRHGMIKNMAELMTPLSNCLQSWMPDAVILLGDRGEMLAGAVVALHLGIPIVHICGGERSGTVDEPIRHSISKMSDLHLVATSQARDRLIRMGECGDRVFIVGAPGVDDIVANYDLSPGRRERDTNEILVVLHPDVNVAEAAGAQAESVINALREWRFDKIHWILPNSDAGGAEMAAKIRSASEVTPNIRLYEHIRRDNYLGLMQACAAMIGNSSSGIVEAGYFGLPVVNLGNRQSMRQPNGDVVNSGFHVAEVNDALRIVMSRAPTDRRPTYVYGTGAAGEAIFREILGFLRDTSISNGKINAY